LGVGDVLAWVWRQSCFDEEDLGLGFRTSIRRVVFLSPSYIFPSLSLALSSPRSSLPFSSPSRPVSFLPVLVSPSLSSLLCLSTSLASPHHLPSLPIQPIIPASQQPHTHPLTHTPLPCLCLVSFHASLRFPPSFF